MTSRPGAEVRSAKPVWISTNSSDWRAARRWSTSAVVQAAGAQISSGHQSGDNAAEARFKEITRAYETLSDPERRLRYDAGALSVASASVSFEFGGSISPGDGPRRDAHLRRSVSPTSSRSARVRAERRPNAGPTSMRLCPDLR